MAEVPNDTPVAPNDFVTRSFTAVPITEELKSALAGLKEQGGNVAETPAYNDVSVGDHMALGTQRLPDNITVRGPSEVVAGILSLVQQAGSTSSHDGRQSQDAAARSTGYHLANLSFEEGRGGGQC